MSSITELCTESQERVKQLERQKRLQEQHKKKKAEAVNLRRQVIIGGIICKYFPETLSLQPRQTELDNKDEFALFEATVALIASDTKYRDSFKEEVQSTI